MAAEPCQPDAGFETDVAGADDHDVHGAGQSSMPSSHDRGRADRFAEAAQEPVLGTGSPEIDGHVEGGAPVHQLAGSNHSLGRDEVERADLVDRSPPTLIAPVTGRLGEARWQTPSSPRSSSAIPTS